MNIFQKAFRGMNLTPGERALLKLLQGFATAGIVSLLLAVPAVLSAKAGQPAITTASVGVMVGAFVHGFLAAWQKYVSAKGDAPLATAIGAIDTVASARLLGSVAAAAPLATSLPSSAVPPPTAPDPNAPIIVQPSAP